MTIRTVERVSIVLNLVLVSLWLVCLGCQQDRESTTEPPPSYGLQGQVLTGSGEARAPVPDAQVTLGNRSTATDRQGKFAFPDVPGGQYELQVVKDRFNDYVQTILVSRSTPYLNITLSLVEIPYYRNVVGRVICSVGMTAYPLPEARVAIEEKRTVTDSTGTFFLENVPYGNHELTVEKPGYLAMRQTLEVGQTTPETVTVPLAAEEELHIERLDNLSGPIWLLNQSDVVSYVGELNRNEVRDRVNDVQVTAGGTKAVLEITDILADSKTLLFKTITFSGALQLVDLIGQAIVGFLDWLFPPQEMYAFEKTEEDGRTYTHVLIPMHPTLNESTDQTMDDAELFRATNPHLGFYQEVARAETPDRMREALGTATRESAVRGCALYSIAVFVDPTLHSKRMVILCGLVELEALVDYFQARTETGQTWTFYTRQPTFQGMAEWPMIYAYRRSIVNESPECDISVQAMSESRMKAFITISYSDPEGQPMVNAQLAFGDGTVWPLFQQEFVNGLYYTEYTYQSTGTMRLAFSADDSGANWHCESSQNFTIVPNTAPTCTITCQDNAVAGDPIHLVVQASDDRQVVRYRYRSPFWDHTTTQNAADFAIHQPGSWQICVAVKDDEDVWSPEACCTVEVIRQNSQPTACFTADPTSGDTSTTFTFTSCSGDGEDTPAQLRYFWSFDGADWIDAGHATTTTHRLATVGGHWVWHKVRDSGGLESPEISELINVSEGNRPPTSTRVTPTPVAKDAGETFTIEWQSSDPDDGDTVAKHQIRDSLSPSWQDLFATSAQLRYANAGNYWLEARAVDSHGLEGTAVRWDIVIAQPNEAPTACFAPDPPSGDTATHIILDSSCSSDDRTPTAVLQKRWDYEGDSNWDTDWRSNNLANHVYAQAGTYYPKLMVRDEDGLTDEVAGGPVVIGNPPNQPPVLTRVTPTPIAEHTGEIFAIEWTATDPDAGDTILKYRIRDSVNQTWQDHYAASVQLRYDNAGNYWFDANAVDSRGLEGSAVRWEITIRQSNHAPTACFSVAPPSGGIGTVFRTDPTCSSDTEDSYDLLTGRWKTDNGAWSTWGALTPREFGPLTVGTHTLWLMVRDSDGAEGEPSSRTVTVEAPSTGTIIVSCNIGQGSWAIQPGNLTGSGFSGNYPDREPGTYSITWESVPNYDTPTGEQKTLAPGGSISFSGVYSYDPPAVHFVTSCPGTWTIQQAVDTWIRAEGGEGAVCYSHSGNLPSGMSFGSDGHLFGTPGTLGSFPVTFHAQDCQVPSNDAYQNCTLVVQDVTPAIEIWPTTIDLRSDLDSERFHVARTQGYSPIHCTISSSNWRVTTSPPSEIVTDGYVTVMLDREGLTTDGNAVVTVTPDGGTPRTCMVYWSASGCSSYYPVLVGPLNGETASRSNLRFRWECGTLPCYRYWIVVFDNPSDDPILSTTEDCGDTSYPYNHDYWGILQTNHWYYWGLAVEAPDHSMSWESQLQHFYVVL